MLMNDISTDKNCKQVSFGSETELMIGTCYERTSRNEMFFSLGEGVLADTNDGSQTSMIIFMELVMRRHCELNNPKNNMVLENLNTNFISTPTTNFILGRTGVVHQTQNTFFMKAQLHCQDILVMSGTAVWSFNN